MGRKTDSQSEMYVIYYKWDFINNLSSRNYLFPQVICSASLNKRMSFYKEKNTNRITL